MIKEVVFDIDGTLYDYERGHAAGMKAMENYVQEQFDVAPEKFRKIYQNKNKEITERLGRDNAAIHSRTIRIQNILEEWQQPLFPHVKKMYELYWGAFFPGSGPEPGILECLEELKKMGISMGIGTDMTARMQYEKLETYGFAPYVSHIVTSQEAGVEKPHRKFMELCIQKSGVKPEECLFVGDNFAKDICGAASSGMKAVWYNPKGKKVPEGMELSVESYHEIHHYEELVPYIQSLQ